MAAALSIISLVIFFAPSAFACAHNTPGKSVPAKPIPEHVFMKFRRSSIFILPIGQSRRRARKISQRPPAQSQLFPESGGSGPRGWRSFLYSGAERTVVRFKHPERSFHGAIRKMLRCDVCVASDTLSPAAATGDGRLASV